MLPIPDIDHTAYWLILGANPIASNGSLMSAPDVAKRLKAIRERGGKVVVIDPCRTETADAATRHHFIRPGTDAAFLLALVNALLELGPPRVERYGDQLAGLDAALAAIRPFGVERAAAATGISADADSHDRARDPRRALRRRVRPHGPLDAALRHRLPVADPGPEPRHRQPRCGRRRDADAGRGAAHRAGHAPGRPGQDPQPRLEPPVFGGELPAVSMAEEIETPGEGQVRAMLTIAGNPVSSTPNGRRLDRALAGLEFMASIDIYVNETTRHADVILPPASMLAHDNYDVVFNALAIRNVARLNPPVFAKPAGALYDWEIFNGIGAAYARRPAASSSRCPPPMVLIDMALRAGPYAKTRRHGGAQGRAPRPRPRARSSRR